MSETKVVKVSELSDSLDELDMVLVQSEIISSFEERGWALYECNTPVELYSTVSIQSLVEFGREKEQLKVGVRYILLPLHERDKDWYSIMNLTKLVLREHRGPYYVEFLKTEDKVVPIAKFLIDSVVLRPPYLYLIPDLRLSSVSNESEFSQLEGKAIEIPLTELWKIRMQLMMSLR